MCCSSYKDLCFTIAKRKNYATSAHVHLFSLTLKQRQTRMIEHNTAQQHHSHLRDIAYKGLIYTETPQTRLKSGNSTSRSLKNLRNQMNGPVNSEELDKKLSSSDESLETLSIGAAVEELRPQPEILPFSVDLPIRCKMLPLVKQKYVKSQSSTLFCSSQCLYDSIIQTVRLQPQIPFQRQRQHRRPRHRTLRATGLTVNVPITTNIRWQPSCSSPIAPPMLIW